MDSYPPRSLGLTLGLSLLALALVASAMGIVILAISEISALIILWVALPLIGIPIAIVIAYQVFGLFTARYRLDGEGFYLRWGLAYEQIPIADIISLEEMPQIRLPSTPGRGAWWPGCITGVKNLEGIGSVEFFATHLGPELLLITSMDHRLAISPSDLKGFKESFSEATQMGSFAPIQAYSRRPNFLLMRIWSNPFARAVILAGLLIPFMLLAFLAFQTPTLPNQVPFGFTPEGQPFPLAPPGRLLLLPFIGGAIWFFNLIAGGWLYRTKRNRYLAYAIWCLGIVSGILLWSATLQLLSVA